jgi:hypothetical protein
MLPVSLMQFSFKKSGLLLGIEKVLFPRNYFMGKLPSENFTPPGFI